MDSPFTQEPQSSVVAVPFISTISNHLGFDRHSMQERDLVSFVSSVYLSDILPNTRSPCFPPVTRAGSANILQPEIQYEGVVVVLQGVNEVNQSD